MGNYLFDPGVLAQLLEDANRSGGSDFGCHVLPSLPGRYRTLAYDFSNNLLPGVAPHEERGYWRDVGTLEALIAARKDTQGSRPRFELHNRAWPIFGHGPSADIQGRQLRIAQENTEKVPGRFPVPVFPTQRLASSLNGLR